MKRRQLLKALAVTAIPATAGCLEGGEEEYATLQRLVLVNSIDEPVTIDLRIETEETVVHEGEYEISAGLDGTVPDCEWPDEPLAVMARRAGDDEWASYETADREGCLSLLCDIHEVGISFFKTSGECPIRNPLCHETAGE